ncbi:hypothetical protein HDV00_000543 [Rhizophlyctis rosea]|nr:hypothetical protein HDV00_000543 [Rhizophlyctis rosea]
MAPNKPLTPEAAFLASKQVKKYASTGKPLVSCEDLEFVSDVMQKLVDNRVLACPVYQHGERFIGLIDMLDIITFLTTLHWTLSRESPSYRDADFTNKFTTTRVHEIIPLPKTASGSQRNLHNDRASAWVSHTATYLDVARVMVETGMYRVPVLEEGRGKGSVGKEGTGEVVHIVTQREMIELLFDGLGELPLNFLIRPIRAFLHPPTPPTPIHTTAKAIEAFRVLISTHVSAVPIVTGHPHTDTENTLYGSISIHHIRRLASNASNVRVLYDEECGVFCRRGGGVRRGSLGSDINVAASVEGTTGGGGEDERGVVEVKVGDGIRTVVEKLNGNKCHRCWVVDDLGRVTGQVSLIDVLREMKIERSMNRA